MSLPICDNHPDGMWCPKCRWPGRDNPKPTDPDDITPEEVSAIEARCDAATPGPWMVADGCGYYVEDRHGNAVAKGFGPLNRPNADVIACAVTQLPRLLAALRRRDAELKRLRIERDWLREEVKAALDELPKRIDNEQTAAAALDAANAKLSELQRAVNLEEACRDDIISERDAANAKLARAVAAIRLFRGPYGLPERGELTAACKAADALLAEIEAEHGK